MAVKASVVIANVRRVLRDEDSTNYRWTDAVLLTYLNDAQEAIVEVRPEANSVRESILLTRGVTLQDVLPADAVRILDITRNMGSDGNTPGPSITIEDKTRLDVMDRNWHNTNPAPTLDHWIFDNRDPKRFFAYPPPPADRDLKVEILYSQIPPEVADTGADITLPDIYRTTMQYFIQGYALLEDDPAADFPRGAGWIQTARQALGLQEQAEEAQIPTTKMPI